MLKYFYIVSIITVITACSTPAVKDDCNFKSVEKMTIRWGESNNETKTFAAYEINAEALLTRITGDSTLPDGNRQVVGHTDKDKFCSYFNQIKKAMVVTQVLNEPGQITRYFEYSDPVNKAYFRVQWVDKFKTKNSMRFREVYDSLQVLADIAK